MRTEFDSAATLLGQLPDAVLETLRCEAENYRMELEDAISQHVSEDVPYGVIHQAVVRLVDTNF